MHLTKLILNNFRCYESLEQTFNATTTIIDGPNGSGKTALIEAIYWQSTGRSFRHHKNNDLIKKQQKQLTVYSEYLYSSIQNHHKLGVSYSTQQKKIIKHNGELIHRQTDIAQKFPVVAIDPNCFLWIDHAPAFRRSFLDWLVFHVEPGYLTQWKQTQKVQQQLNQLLKQGKTEELILWQKRYVQLAERTEALRLNVFKEIQDRFNTLIESFLPTINNLRLTYKKGWRDDLLENLINKQSYHLKQGYIDVGIHKADLLCLVDQQSAQVYLSRGQKKLIAIIMYLIFIEIYEAKHRQPPLVCLDDIDSELDHRALQLLSQYLLKSPRQLFITTVEANAIQPYFLESEVFHVKQDKLNNAMLTT